MKKFRSVDSLRKLFFLITSSLRLALWVAARKHRLICRTRESGLKSLSIKPLVSIIIPTHRPNHFKNALKCALSQTYTNTEIIVSDNSGGSEIAEICSQYKDVIYRKNIDGQVASNVAKPLSLAKGDYIKYIFDDDLIYPNCIETMIGWLSQFGDDNIKNIGVITSSRHWINDDSICYKETCEPNIASASLIDGRQVIKKMLLAQRNFVGEFSTTMFKRDMIDYEDPLDIFTIFGENFSTGLIDIPLYFSILQKSDLLYIPYSLSAFRIHAGGGSNIHSNPNFHLVISDWFRLIRAARQNGILSRNETKIAVRCFLIVAKRFAKHFPEQLIPWQEAAIDFVLTSS